MNVITNNLDGLICPCLPYLGRGGMELSTEQIFYLCYFSD